MNCVCICNINNIIHTYIYTGTNFNCSVYIFNVLAMFWHLALATFTTPTLKESHTSYLVKIVKIDL
jgi:hypothetical protein